MDLKNRAESTELAPRDLLHEAKSKHGVAAIVMSGSNASLQRMISRARDEKCPDTEAVDSPIPHFQGKMLLDNDQGKFLLFDEVVAQTGGRNVGFGSSLALEVLENSEILLTDGTFAVATPPFRQLWTIHAKFGDSTIPVVHVLMTFRGIDDYKHALEKIKTYIPNWNPTDYLGDLEIGQRKAVSDVFQGIRTSFCYFHLLQAWYRQLKKLKQDDLTRYGEKNIFKLFTFLLRILYIPLLVYTSMPSIQRRQQGSARL
ncbi:hypothetical protein B9Z55_024379 [Caenorhabditis nigoni]|uniref:MULE transposase domain-containing protein n=1 Tax=Caenorhabditis nigoni TaxID=1611254 RepID=A0A2G5STP9_9PELO|nr:hypothetical protein B9Z55_024379 [Caenorhabditis nigoni]